MWQLPVGFIAQLVEHCTGFAEVMGSNPVQDSLRKFLGITAMICHAFTTLTSNQVHSQFRTKADESHTVKIPMINISSSSYKA